MRVLAPLTRASEVPALVDAGADELYCGVLTREWLRRFSNAAAPNFRDFTFANLRSFDELARAVRAAHASEVPVYVTFNSPAYSGPQEDLLRDEVRAAVEAGADAAIVTAWGAATVREACPGLELHVSTLGDTLNRRAALFYRSLGASRVNLAQHLTLEEACGLVGAIGESCPFMETECFVFSGLCQNTEGLCAFCHGLDELGSPRATRLLGRALYGEGFLRVVEALPGPVVAGLRRVHGRGRPSACSLPWRARPLRPDQSGLDLSGYARFINGFGMLCGLCGLADLAAVGVTAAKVIGRSYSTARKVADVRLVRRLVDLACRRPEREPFRRAARQAFAERMGFGCEPRHCYYPGEVGPE